MMSTPASSSMASTSRLPPSTSKVPTPSTSSLGIYFSSPGRRLSECHNLKVPANVRARVGSPEVLAGPLRGTLPRIIRARARARSSDDKENLPMQNLPKIETVEQAREVLNEMDEEQELTAELDEWKASITKHNDQEFSVSFADYETGIINLWNASHILLEHGDHDLYLSRA